MQRRRFLKLVGTGVTTLAVAGTGAAVWLSGPPVTPRDFASITEARRWVAQLALAPGARSMTAWPLAKVLAHCAQSIELSLTGYPAHKSAAFKRSAGRLAFAAFSRAGAMRHDLTEPIPEAPEIEGDDLAAAVLRLDAAWQSFERHTGVLAPHFAYGPLDRIEYTRAHLLHLGNHAERIGWG